MNKELLFTKIEQLLAILKEFMDKGTAQISIDQKVLLKEVYKEIMPSANPDVNCSSCVLHLLHVIASYVERERF